MDQHQTNVDTFLLQLFFWTKDITSPKTYAPLANGLMCSFCTNVFYEKKAVPEDWVMEVQCLNCHGTFYFDSRDKGYPI